MTTERSDAIKFKGNGMTLLGPELAVGSQAPDFALTATDMSTKSLADYADKVKIFSIVPSVDTPVCDTQTRTFSKQLAEVSDDIVVLTVSVDLPFAFKRWCGAAGVENVECLSDFKDHEFGKTFGVRIKELGILARAVVVIDKDNTIKHVEYVGEVTEEPDYTAAFEAAKALA